MHWELLSTAHFVFFFLFSLLKHLGRSEVCTFRGSEGQYSCGAAVHVMTQATICTCKQRTIVAEKLQSINQKFDAYHALNMAYPKFDWGD